MSTAITNIHRENFANVDSVTQNWLDKTESCRKAHIAKIVGLLALTILGGAAGAGALVFVLTVSPLAVPIFIGITLFSGLSMLSSLVSMITLPFFVFMDDDNYRDPKNAKPVIEKFCNHSLNDIFGKVDWVQSLLATPDSGYRFCPERIAPAIQDSDIDMYANYGLIPTAASSTIKDFIAKHHALRLQHWQQTSASDYAGLIITSHAMADLNAEWVAFRNANIRGNVPTM